MCAPPSFSSHETASGQCQPILKGTIARGQGRLSEPAMKRGQSMTETDSPFAFHPPLLLSLRLPLSTLLSLSLSLLSATGPPIVPTFYVSSPTVYPLTRASTVVSLRLRVIPRSQDSLGLIKRNHPCVCIGTGLARFREPFSPRTLSFLVSELVPRRAVNSRNEPTLKLVSVLRSRGTRR